jgi:ApbE superfamily uncharacterized protein (UPF0280 family)
MTQNVGHSASGRAQVALVADGRRLHLHDGPIDLIVEAWGAPAAVQSAYRAARDAFVGLLDALCAELPSLRARALTSGASLQCATSRRMQDAVRPYAAQMFITPMASVAGSVADEVLAAMLEAAPGLVRAYVNNGGDIALHLAERERFSVGLVDRPDRPSLFGTAEICAADGVRGIATSGARGRSFSLGIADAVTVLAASAAQADAAATVIANAVDLPGDARILRVPARDVQPDSDLGDVPVTRSVPELTQDEIERALQSGLAKARDLVSRGLIVAASLHLQGVTLTTRADRPQIHPSRKAENLLTGGAHV